MASAKEDKMFGLPDSASVSKTKHILGYGKSQSCKFLIDARKVNAA